MEHSNLQVIKQLLLEEGADPTIIEFQLKEMTLSDRPNPKKSSPIKPKAKQEKPMECSICLEELLSEKATICLRNCPDIIHIECLENYLVMKISERSFPLKCPLGDCKKEIHIDDIKDSIQTKLQYQILIEEYSVKSYLELNPQDFDYCKTPDCDFAYLKNPQEKRFDCLECKKVYCKECEDPWQTGHDCSEPNNPPETQNQNLESRLPHSNTRPQPLASNRNNLDPVPRILNPEQVTFPSRNRDKKNPVYPSRNLVLQRPIITVHQNPQLLPSNIRAQQVQRIPQSSVQNVYFTSPIHQNPHPRLQPHSSNLQSSPFPSMYNPNLYSGLMSFGQIGQTTQKNSNPPVVIPPRVDPHLQAKENDRLFENLSVQSGYRNCPKCTVKVEKTQGCDHMRCRCGTQFCYRCGGYYGNCACNRR